MHLKIMKDFLWNANIEDMFLISYQLYDVVYGWPIVTLFDVH